jgi:tetratricopeptide (TPR) repeat protein
MKRLAANSRCITALKELAIALTISFLIPLSLGAVLARPSGACVDEASARRAFKVSPTSFAALEMGLSLACHSKLPEAIALYHQIIQKDPAFASGFDVYTNLGHALRQQGKVKEAIAAYQTAIQHRASPQSGAYQSLSALLRQEGRTQEADAILQKMPLIDPEGSI